MNNAVIPASETAPRRRSRARRQVASNVIQLHQRIMPRHAELLARWVQAGRTMGLCDAAVVAPDRSSGFPTPPASDYVLVWVRENIDPAYIIRPERVGWAVIDAVRDNELGRTRDFAAALHMIRPVLKVDQAA